MDIVRKLERWLSQAREDQDILAVILFGSVARGEQTPTSDVDVYLVLQPGEYNPLTLSRKKLAYLQEGTLDIHIFQQLPLYIRTRVLEEGQILLERDTDALYELAFRTAQAFEDYKPITADHLQGLRSLVQDYPYVEKRVIVCLEPKPRRTEDGILILPASEFCERPAAGDLF